MTPQAGIPAHGCRWEKSLAGVGKERGAFSIPANPHHSSVTYFKHKTNQGKGTEDAKKSLQNESRWVGRQAHSGKEIERSYKPVTRVKTSLCVLQ